MITIHINTKKTNLQIEGQSLIIESPEESKSYLIRYISCLYISTDITLNTTVIQTFFEKDKPIFFTRRQGHIYGSTYSPTYGPGVGITQKQLKLCTTAKAKQLALNWVNLKIQKRQLLLNKPLSIIKNLTNEGSVDKTYWAEIKKRIPIEWGFKKRTHKNSKDPANILLNYIYGFMYFLIERILLKNNLDPYIGFNHGMSRNQKAFLFDTIEPFRPWCETIWLNFIQENPNKFNLITEGNLDTTIRKEIADLFQSFIYSEKENRILRIKLIENFIKEIKNEIKNA